MSNGKQGPDPTYGKFRFMAMLLPLLLAGCPGDGGGSGSGGSGSLALLGAVIPGPAGSPGASTTDPTVISSTPINGATNVATSINSATNVVTATVLTATFSQPMDPATINSSPAGTLLTFTLLETTGSVNVPGTVAMNGANTVATFTPTAAALAANTSYTAVVTTAAKNAGGTAMANPVAWSFTTKSVAFTSQATVDLGLAGNYAIFANTGITNSTVPAAVTGDMGTGPAVTSTAIVNFSLNLPAGSAYSTSAQVTGKVYAFDYAAPTPANVTTASANMDTAYNDAAGRLLPDFQDLATGNLNGLTLTPGLYNWGTAVTLSSDVTISGGPDDIWIFQIAGSLSTGAATNVFLSGGAQARNIFWQVAGATATLGANAHFEGIVLAKFAITFGNQASANSRLLAQTAVTINQSTVTQPGSAPSTSGITVSSSNPIDGATNVATSSNSATNVVTGTALTATFSGPMDPATINSSPAGTLLTFTLMETTGSVNVPGTVAMNSANTVATFTPTAAALTANTNYTATVTTAAQSAGGTAMANPVTWSFTTKSVAFTAQAPVNLGLAGNYAIFALTGIDNATAGAAITGHMGVGPGVTSTAITGPWALNLPAGGAYSTSPEVAGKVYAFDYAAPTPTDVTTAMNDMGTAYTDAAGRLLPDYQDLMGGNLAGLTLTPGLYNFGTNVDLPVTTNVTLSGGPNDIWIFQIAGILTTGANTNIFLSGGAQAKNIFWQVAGTSVTLGANAHFEGIVLAQVAINFGNQASANSRLLAQAAVNLDQNLVSQPAP